MTADPAAWTDRAPPAPRKGTTAWPPPGGVRSLDERDLPEVLRLLSHPAISRWIPDMASATAPERLGRFLAGISRLPPPFGSFGAFDDAGLLVNVALFPAPDGRVLMSYAARPDAQGCGCASRLAAIVLLKAAEISPSQVVTCTVESENRASIRVAEKLGFHCIGDRPYYGPSSSGRKAGPFFERDLGQPCDDLVALAAQSPVDRALSAWRRRCEPEPGAEAPSLG